MHIVWEASAYNYLRETIKDCTHIDKPRNSSSEMARVYIIKQGLAHVIIKSSPMVKTGEQ